MAESKRKADQTKIEVEPGADKRLANILKRSLNTAPRHVEDKRKKPAKAK